MPALAAAATEGNTGVAGGDATSVKTGVDPARGQRAPNSQTVTLITGDKVQLTTYPGERAAITVDPAPRRNGATPGFHKWQADGTVYVVPADAARYVPDRLDLALFDVAALVEQGYADADARSLPVIIEYKRSAGARHAVTSLPTFTKTTGLPSIEAVAGDVDKSRADDLGMAILTKPTLASVDKIWLDRQVYAADEDSAPQIGAPVAWEAGFTGSGVRVAVLDTGIDQTHPDLAGRVVAEANFSDSSTAADRVGHGSHVASTLAGTGAASGGLRRGIAFDADLMNGKVLGDDGSGALSQIVEGMQWAASSGAEIVNMSLGASGLYTDGTDPLSQAVDRLSADPGILFVIAAGNDGPGEGTVTSPGAASSALTVGAVDKSDVLAGFSSRGPRVRDFAPKPDVTAPGVGIIAARATGTSLGSPVDDYYTSANGTSMATPHVAGAAAALLQQRPDVTGQELKALLTSTAVPTGSTVYEEGGGRIDLARAVTTNVLPSASSLGLGYFPYPQDDNPPTTKTLTYRNFSNQDITLAIGIEVTDRDGTAPPASMLTVDAQTLTLPAGGTADLGLTVDPTLGDYGLYGGYVTATDERGNVTRTTVGFFKESERYDLTVTGIARDGRPAGGISGVDVVNVDDVTLFSQTDTAFKDGQATFRVPPGNYAVMSYIFTYDEPHVFALESAAVSEPQVEVSADTAITLDARTADEIEVHTPRPSEPSITTLSYHRSDAMGGSQSHSFTFSAPTNRAFASPTDTVTTGEFEFYSMWALFAPDVIVTKEPDGEQLNLQYAVNSARLDGHQNTELVFAGIGGAQDFASVDVAGKIALIKRGELTFADKMHNAEAAGATAAIIFNNVPGTLIVTGNRETIPTLTMSQTDGDALVSAMGGTPLPVQVDAVAQSPYLYEQIFPEPGQIPSDLTYQVTGENSVTIDNRYRSHVPANGVGELRHKWRPWETFSFGFLRRMDAPLERMEYVTADDTRWAQHFWGHSSDANPFGFHLQDEMGTFHPHDSVDDSWVSQVAVPGFWPANPDPEESTAYRDGTTLGLDIPEWGDREGHWGYRDPTSDTSAFRLFESGRLISESERAVGLFPVGDAAADYRLELDVTRAADWWTMSTETSSAWTVHTSAPNGPPEVLPLLHLNYTVGGLDMLNRTKRSTGLALDIEHQPGAASAPIAGARLWVSTDDGNSWSRTRLRQRGPDSFHAAIHRLENQAKYVSLKVEVWDTGGNRLEQEVLRAYGLR